MMDADDVNNAAAAADDDDDHNDIINNHNDDDDDDDDVALQMRCFNDVIRWRIFCLKYFCLPV
jgi:hypothetical protein